MRANTGALSDWYDKALRDAKRAMPSKPWDPTLEAQKGRWLDAPQMYKVADDELQAGDPRGRCSHTSHVVSTCRFAAVIAKGSLSCLRAVSARLTTG